MAAGDGANFTGSTGSVAPGRLIKLQTYSLHRVPTSAARSSATASENGRAQPAVGLRRLYFGTGRWRGEFPADRMTAIGRDFQFAADLDS